MGANRRSALRQTRERRRRDQQAALARKLRPDGRPSRPRPPVTPIALRVVIPRDIPPAVQAVFDAAAHRVEALARVRFVPVADLPDDVTFGVQLPGDGTHPPRGRRARAAAAFASAWLDVAVEDPAVEALVDAWMAGRDGPAGAEVTP